MNHNLSKAQKKIKELAEWDSLTGLYNRRLLYDWVQREMNRSVRYKCPISVIMLDIDFFKNINDQYGHKAGDITLKKFSELLETSSRDSDFTSRYGGDESLIILTNTDLKGASIFAENFLARLHYTEIVLPQGQIILITASLGITSRDLNKEKQRLEFNLLIDEADSAMYRAKIAGRDRICIYRK